MDMNGYGGTVRPCLLTLVCERRSVYETRIGKQGVATSGHLMPYSDLQFGLYIPVSIPCS